MIAKGADGNPADFHFKEDPRFFAKPVRSAAARSIPGYAMRKLAFGAGCAPPFGGDAGGVKRVVFRARFPALMTGFCVYIMICVEGENAS